MAIVPLLLALLFHVQLPLSSTAATTGLRVGLTHVDSTGSFSASNRFHRAVRRSHHRRKSLESHFSRSDVTSPVEYDSFEYLLELSIGTPAFPITAILDTGSDLIWTQCIPCFECLRQPTPYYNPSNSSSFAFLPCSSPSCTGIPTGCTLRLCQYNASYGDGTISQGFLATETLTFGESAVAGLTFGCAMANSGSLSNSTGIVGMGRGSLSLPSQLHPRKFSYCLTPFGSSSTSHLFLGAMAGLGSASFRSTPIVQNPYVDTFYYLILNSISVGGTVLRIPPGTFQLRPDGSGGTIIDSGTFLTILEQAGYEVLKKELIAQTHAPVAVNLPADLQSGGVDLCFSMTSGELPSMPEVVLHFEGADMSLPRDKYMLQEAEWGLFCSTFVGAAAGLSIFGNYQQQDMHLLFDLEAHVLSFARATCDRL